MFGKNTWKIWLRRLGVSGLLCTAMLLTQAGAVFAADAGGLAVADTDSVQGWPAGPQIGAKSAVLMDVDTGAVLYAKNADEKQYPASITKIMTAWLACEKLNDLNKVITVSESAAFGIEQGSSSIWADTGEQFTVEQAFMAVLLESANEMSLALAQESSGSVKKFVELMNARAAKVGCINTHFNNPNGLPDELHYTSAADMARIAAGAWRNMRFRRFVTTDYYEIPPTNIFEETRYLLNHHKMMKGRDYAYNGVLGGKTGYTEAAGSTLVTYAKSGKLTVVAVVMNAVDGAYADTAALLDYGFQNFTKEKVRIVNSASLSKRLPCDKYILKNWEDRSSLYSYRRKIFVTLPAGADKKKLTSEKTVLGSRVGPSRLKTTYYYHGQQVGFSIQYVRNVLSDFLVG